MKTAQQLEIEVNNLAGMCANTARYLREAHEVNATLLEALEACERWKHVLPEPMRPMIEAAIAKAKAEQS